MKKRFGFIFIFVISMLCEIGRNLGKIITSIMKPKVAVSRKHFLKLIGKNKKRIDCVIAVVERICNPKTHSEEEEFWVIFRAFGEKSEYADVLWGDYIGMAGGEGEQTKKEAFAECRKQARELLREIKGKYPVVKISIINSNWTQIDSEENILNDQ